MMLYYIALHNNAIAPAKWSFKIQSCIIWSCIFRNIGPANSGPAFSGPSFSALPDENYVVRKDEAKSRIWGAETPEQTAIKICMPDGVHDVIMNANFG